MGCCRLKAEALNSYQSSSSQELSGESGAEDDLLAGPMDIDDSSYSRNTARAGQPGADQDMTEVAEILLKMNVNSARQRRCSPSTVPPMFSHCFFEYCTFSGAHTSGCRDICAQYKWLPRPLHWVTCCRPHPIAAASRLHLQAMHV